MRAILTYHSIDETGSPISIGRATFRRHVEFLADAPVRVVPLLELLAHPDDADAVALTFDDGFENFETEAAPLLAAHGMPATVFVVSDHIGKSNAWNGRHDRGVPTLPLMGWEALGRLAELGVSLGAHGRSHRPLDLLTDQQVEDELAACNQALRSNLAQVPAVFAYPYGRTSPVAIAAARAHYTASCGTELRALRRHDDHAQLPRVDAYYLRTPGRIERWGSGELRSYLWIRSQARRVRQSLETVTQMI